MDRSQRLPVEIRLLGGFAVTRGHEAVPISSRAAQLLLAYLVLGEGSRQPRERLAALLWPDAQEEAGRQNLRNSLYLLRKALGAERFRADKLSVEFDRGEDVWVDVAALESRTNLDVARLEEAAQAYRGDLLPGFLEEWVLLERRRLRGAYDQLMTKLVDGLLGAGRLDDARAWSEQWISIGEAPEPAYRALMVANHRLGDRTGIAGAYRRCVAALEQELGVEPSPETEQLYRSLMNGRRGAAVPVADESRPEPAPAASVPPSLVRADSVPNELAPAREFPKRAVGREDELSSLLDRLDAAFRGGGGIAFVAGEAGRGKSTLLAELSYRAQERWERLAVAVGRCNALSGVGDPLLPFREVLEQLTGDVGIGQAGHAFTPAHAQRLRGLTPAAVEALLSEGVELLGTVLRSGPLVERAVATGSEGLVEGLRRVLADIHESASASRERLFDACTRFLRRLSQASPILIVLEDLHWADPSSIALLFNIARSLAGSRLMIVGSFRKEDMELEDRERLSALNRTIAELERIFGEMTIDLDASPGGRKLLDPLIDLEPNRLGEDFRDRLASVTGGNPLFAVELLSEMKATGGLERGADGAWVESSRLDWRVTPARIQGVIRSRVDRLDPDLREALTIGSVEGEVFTAEAVAKVVGMEPRELVRSLGDAASRRHHLVDGLEVVRRAGVRLTRFRFRHNLFRQYLYGTLSPLDRSILHEELGVALEEIAGDGRAELAFVLAYHFTEAGMPARAVPYLRLAGSRAISLSAPAEAWAHLRRALDLVALLPEGEERDREELGVRLLSGRAQQSLSGFSTDEVGETYERAAQLAQGLSDGRSRFSALWSLSLFHSQRGEFERAKRLGEELLELAEREAEPVLRVQARHAQWFAAFCLGDLAAAMEHTRDGLERYVAGGAAMGGEEYGGHDAAVCGHLFRARALWFMGYPDRSRDECEAGLSVAATLNGPNSVAHAYTHAAEVYLLRSEGERALELAEAAIAVAEEKGLRFWAAWGRMLRGCALILTGRFAAGIEEALGGRSEYPDIGHLEELLLGSRLSRAYRALGDVPAARRCLEEAVTATGNFVSGAWRAEYLRLEAEARLLEGESGRAEAWDLLQRAVDVARLTGALAIELQAAMTLASCAGSPGEAESAHSALAAAYGRFSEGFDTTDLRRAGELIRAREELRGATG